MTEIFGENFLQGYQVFINNKHTVIYLPPSNSHFTDLNLLGMEYLKSSGTNLSIILTNDYDSISLQFDHEKNEIISQLLSSKGVNLMT
jgi:hypothetical protein